MIDIHQHLVPDTVAGLLAARRAAPRLADGLLHAPGEPAAPFAPAVHDVAARTRQVAADGLERALVMLPGGLAIESLPEDEARPLLDAWLETAAALPSTLGAWAHVSLVACDADEVDHALDCGCVGLHLPAGALADPAAAERVGPLLEACARRGAPVLVHPGPGPGRPRLGPWRGQPGWWATVVPYAQELHAAWWTIRVAVRPALPALRICVVALAGLAPLHDERFGARSGERLPVDPLLFVDTSSFGTRAIDAAIRTLGVDVLVHGSDRPVLEPVAHALGDAVDHALRVTNPARLLHRVEVLP